MNEKIAKRMERVFKGVANKKRVRILELIGEENNMTLWQISQGLSIEFRNALMRTLE